MRELMKRGMAAALLLCLLTACGGGEDILPEPSGVESASVRSSMEAGASEPERSRVRPPVEEDDPVVWDNVNTGEPDDPAALAEPDDDVEEYETDGFSPALERFYAYLLDALGRDQIGGIEVDHANRQIIVWVVDAAAVDRAVAGYDGEAFEVVRQEAAYSVNELLDILYELMDSEIVPYTNGIGMGYGDRVHIYVNGEEHVEEIEEFLRGFPHREAVTYAAYPKDLENPLV